MTASARLAALRARYGGLISVAKLDDPLARALWWKRERWRLEHIRANDYWPDDIRYDYVSTDLGEARDKHRKIIVAMWDARKLERLAASVHVRPSLSERRRWPVVA